MECAVLRSNVTLLKIFRDEMGLVLQPYFVSQACENLDIPMTKYLIDEAALVYDIDEPSQPLGEQPIAQSTTRGREVRVISRIVGRPEEGLVTGRQMGIMQNGFLAKTCEKFCCHAKSLASEMVKFR